MMRLALLLLLFVPFVFSSLSPEFILLGKSLTGQGFSTGNDTLDFFVDNWYMLAVAGITISFLIALIMYMGSKLLNSEYLAFYSRMELEAVMNAIAVLLVLNSVVFILDNIFSGDTPGTNTIVSDVLDTLTFNEKKMVSTYASTLREISEINLKASRTLTFGIDEVLVGSPTYSRNLQQEARADVVLKAKVLSHISNLYVYGTGLKTMFSTFLIPVSVLMVGLGMFLYSFYFTRRFGATMVALGIAGYVVLPLLLHFLMTLAGFIQPSSPFLPGPDCPSLCSMPVPSVVTEDGEVVDVNAELENVTLAKPELQPFENVDFVNLFRISKGQISTTELSSGPLANKKLYSCDNLTDWGLSPSTYTYSTGDSVSVEPFCPSTCRVLPYPDQLSTCREYAYNCQLFLERGGERARACFKNLSLSGEDYVDDSRTTQKTVPVLSVSGGKLTTLQKDPVIAATEYACGVLQPTAIPPNIPLKHEDGTQYDVVKDNKIDDLFCPNVYRYVSLDFSSLPEVDVELPYETSTSFKESCAEFFEQAAALNDFSNLVRDTAALFNPGKQICLVLEVTDLEHQETVTVTSGGTCEEYASLPDFVKSAYPEPFYVSPMINSEYTGQTGTAQICYNFDSTTLTDEATCVPVKCECTRRRGLLGFFGLKTTTGRCSDFHGENCDSLKVLSCEATVYKYELQTKLQVQPSGQSINEQDARSLLGGGLPFQEPFERFLEGSGLQGDYLIEGSCTSFNPSQNDEQRKVDIVDEAQRIVNKYELGVPVFVRGQCGNIAAVPSEALTLPPTVDCSKCAKFGRSPLAANVESSIQGMEFLANAYIRIMLIPMIALALTAGILVALSSYLGGEMFIPAIRKVL